MKGGDLNGLIYYISTHLNYIGYDWTVINQHGRCGVYNGIRRHYNLCSVYSANHEMAFQEKKEEIRFGPTGPFLFRNSK